MRESEGIALELFPICETHTRKLIRATGEELRERGEEKREENLFIILESKSHRDKSDFVTCIQKF